MNRSKELVRFINRMYKDPVLDNTTRLKTRLWSVDSERRPRGTAAACSEQMRARQHEQALLRFRKLSSGLGEPPHQLHSHHQLQSCDARERLRVPPRYARVGSRPASRSTLTSMQCAPRSATRTHPKPLLMQRQLSGRCAPLIVARSRLAGADGSLERADLVLVACS